VAKRLERDFDIIMVDFRGQGRTERGTATYSQALLVQDVVALLSELDLDP
jgi:pimeloyl-ACP methyl ester carboxylesterase